MLFSSLTFLYCFLPIVIILYFLSPKKMKNYILLGSSLFFYGCGEPKYVIVMIISIITNYVLGILIDKYRQNNYISKCILIISIIFSLGLLGYFKYVNFFIENFSRLTNIPVEPLNIVLPIGISFYTFQILSYVIDVYRNKVPVQKNPLTLGTYIVFFPQLIAGPIVRYSDIVEQLGNRQHSFEKIYSGIKRFCFGLGKKVLLANVLGTLVNTFQNTSEKTVMFIWLFAIAYSLQIYFDFSGYSDMAIGLGKIFGFDFCENFNYPFIAKSITEFWRRWHISLGSWFRDYVYIPMGGNKCSKFQFILNICTVWGLTGFWHGAEWNFIVWGIYFAVLLLFEKQFLKQYLNKYSIFQHVYVLFFVIISFVIFYSTNLEDLRFYISGMFGLEKIPFINEYFVYNLKNYLFVLIISIFSATPIFSYLNKKIRNNKSIIFNSFEILYLLGILVISTAFLVDSSFNPFLYFRF